MPTHKTKSCFIDAVQYHAEDAQDLINFCGGGMVQDASLLFPDEDWTPGFKVVRVGGTWLTIGEGQWLIKVDGVLDRIINDEEFQETYENV